VKILLYSTCFESMLLVQNLEAEGHSLVMYCDDKSEVGDGIVWKTSDPDEAAAQADLVIFDDNGMGKVADRYRAKGYRVWNGGMLNDRLEHDRKLGMKVFQQCGIPIPKTVNVSNLKQVEEAAGQFKRAVIKIDGEDKAGSSYSFVADDSDQLVEQVVHWEEEGLLKGGWSGIVQEFVKGIEVSTEGWFCDGKWTNLNITLEEKKACSGNLGQSIGCAFNTVLSIKETSKLFKIVLQPLTQFLAKSGFVGQIDTNAIVCDGKPYALEFTPRCGYDATPTLAWGRNSYGADVAAALGLECPDRVLVDRGKVWCGVRVSTPPYPVEVSDEKVYETVYEAAHGVPVENWEGGDFYFYDVALDPEKGLYVAGACGIVGVALGGGDDVAEAARHAYSVADKLKIPNKSYRALDGHKRAMDALPELEEMGLIRR